MKTPTLFIGANVFDHDSSLFMVLPERKEMVAISTERVTRVKHDKLFFFPALEKAIAYKDIDTAGVEMVHLGHSFTHAKKDYFRANEYQIQLAERSHYKVAYVKDLEASKEDFKRKNTIQKIASLLRTQPGRFLLMEKIKDRIGLMKRVGIEDVLRIELQKIFPNAAIMIDFFDHQECHTISSYYTSPFSDALLISYDGWGDDLFSRVFHAKQGKITEISKSECPKITVSESVYPYTILGSPGGIYAYVTHLLGFKPLSEEGKVEALAAYAKPDLKLYDAFMNIFSLDTDAHALVCNKELAEKTISREIMQSFIETLSREVVAASVQKFLDDISRTYVADLVKHTGENNICFSGGTCANVIMNLNVFEHITKHIHITPAMADDGTAQGAAVLLMKKNGFSDMDLDWMKGEQMPYYGTSYNKEEVLASLERRKNDVTYEVLGEDWPAVVAKLLTDGKVGALYHGRMEWGPRALGNRSIVADPTRPEFRDKINKTIKRRPLFQPFCPSILAEEANRLFENFYLNKHMTCAFRMKKEFWDALPSAIHIDGTARVQFVERHDNPQYHKLLTEVKKINGYGVVINTSFNKHGRTIVESPEDALRDFIDTDMDYLLIEGILVTRR
jgi:carbamoyltransferase